MACRASTPSRTPAYATSVYRGEHNQNVLADWLEMGSEEIAELEESGTLLAETTA
jgi:hypothetical protein